MQSTSFYDNLEECSTLEEQLRLIRITAYDLYMESQPSAVCQYLLIKSDDEAKLAAKVMVQRFGSIIVDREGSSCVDKIGTIIDELEFLIGNRLMPLIIQADDGKLEEIVEPYIRVGRDYAGDLIARMGYMYRAFISMGMKPASEYNSEILSYIYGSDPCYKNYSTTIANYREFEPNMELKRELIEYLHHPRFIAKWVEDNELENYLQ